MCVKSFDFFVKIVEPTTKTGCQYRTNRSLPNTTDARDKDSHALKSRGILVSDLIASFNGAIEDRLVERIRMDRPYASCRACQGSKNVSKERSRIPIPANAAFQIRPNLCFTATPAGQDPVTIHPIIDGEADEIHDFLFSRSVTVLRQADQGNAYHIPAVPVCRILRCKKDIEFRAIFLQNTLYLRRISVWGGGMPDSSGLPSALESRFQRTRYPVPIDGTPNGPYIFANETVTVWGVL
jgi:hypothetical protein